MIIRGFFLALLVLCGSVCGAEPIELRAGKLTMLFEPDNAFLRQIRIGEHMVLQGISAPVRDRFWGTVPPKISNLKLNQSSDSFTLGFDISCRQREIDFVWKGQITGSAEGKVTFTFDGEAQSDFERNRIGFCVLHPAEAAGKPCSVESVNGEVTKGAFPSLISANQPFMNIRAIGHEVIPGTWAKVRMEGDTFEMEDQRNWTDASFKTYCTPLAIPYPVPVKKGSKVSQRIELSIEGAEKIAERPAESTERVTIRLLGQRSGGTPLPGIGLQVSSQTAELTRDEVARLRDLHLQHLRVDLTLPDPKAASTLDRAASQAALLEIPLVVALHLGESGQKNIGDLKQVLAKIESPSTWLLIAATDEQVESVRQFLRGMGQKARVGRGEDTNFTELNRMRPDPSKIDVVSYGMNPQVHAFDNMSIVETLPIQGETVRSARQFVGELPIIISPITLKTQKMNQPPAAGELPSRVDPRQQGLFAGAWTLGSIKYLSEAGVQSVTYYETVGWLGIMESASGSPLPDQFPSKPGQLFPIYHVLHSVGEFSGGSIHETTSSNPMSVVALAVEKGDKRRLLVANLTAKKRSTNVEGFEISTFDLKRLDADHPTPTVATDGIHRDQGRIQIDLPPHGIAVLTSR